MWRTTALLQKQWITSTYIVSEFISIFYIIQTTLNQTIIHTYRSWADSAFLRNVTPKCYIKFHHRNYGVFSIEILWYKIGPGSTLNMPLIHNLTDYLREFYSKIYGKEKKIAYGQTVWARIGYCDTICDSLDAQPDTVSYIRFAGNESVFVFVFHFTALNVTGGVKTKDVILTRYNVNHPYNVYIFI